MREMQCGITTRPANFAGAYALARSGHLFLVPADPWHAEKRERLSDYLIPYACILWGISFLPPLTFPSLHFVPLSPGILY